METGHIPMGNRTKPKNVSSLVNSDSKLKSAKPTGGMRVGNTSKAGNMDKPFK